jgi:hypothetical protein
VYNAIHSNSVVPFQAAVRTTDTHTITNMQIHKPLMSVEVDIHE